MFQRGTGLFCSSKNGDSPKSLDDLNTQLDNLALFYKSLEKSKANIKKQVPKKIGNSFTQEEDVDEDITSRVERMVLQLNLSDGDIQRSVMVEVSKNCHLGIHFGDTVTFLEPFILQPNYFGAPSPPKPQITTSLQKCANRSFGEYLSDNLGRAVPFLKRRHSIPVNNQGQQELDHIPSASSTNELPDSHEKAAGDWTPTPTLLSSQDFKTGIRLLYARSRDPTYSGDFQPHQLQSPPEPVWYPSSPLSGNSSSFSSGPQSRSSSARTSSLGSPSAHTSFLEEQSLGIFDTRQLNEQCRGCLQAGCTGECQLDTSFEEEKSDSADFSAASTVEVVSPKIGHGCPDTPERMKKSEQHNLFTPSPRQAFGTLSYSPISSECSEDDSFDWFTGKGASEDVHPKWLSNTIRSNSLSPGRISREISSEWVDEKEIEDSSVSSPSKLFDLSLGVILKGLETSVEKRESVSDFSDLRSVCSSQAFLTTQSGMKAKTFCNLHCRKQFSVSSAPKTLCKKTSATSEKRSCSCDSGESCQSKVPRSQRARSRIKVHNFQNLCQNLKKQGVLYKDGPLLGSSVQSISNKLFQDLELVKNASLLTTGKSPQGERCNTHDWSNVRRGTILFPRKLRSAHSKLLDHQKSSIRKVKLTVERNLNRLQEIEDGFRGSFVSCCSGQSAYRVPVAVTPTPRSEQSECYFSTKSWSGSEGNLDEFFSPKIYSPPQGILTPPHDTCNPTIDEEVAVFKTMQFQEGRQIGLPTTPVPLDTGVIYEEASLESSMKKMVDDDCGALKNGGIGADTLLLRLVESVQESSNKIDTSSTKNSSRTENSQSLVSSFSF